MYAVIVVSTTGYWATSNNYRTMEAAKDSAMAICRQHAPGCKVVATNSDGCVALAGTDRHWGGGYGPTKSEAEQSALAENNGGRILVSFCTS